MPPSHVKRCALAKERERRIKAEENLKNITATLQETQEEVKRVGNRADRALDWVGRMMADFLLLKVYCLNNPTYKQLNCFKYLENFFFVNN